jgi:hypothetical protein
MGMRTRKDGMERRRVVVVKVHIVKESMAWIFPRELFLRDDR